MFHVSLLKKYIPDTNHVIDWNVIQVTRVLLFSLLIYRYMYEHGTNHVIEWIMIQVELEGNFPIQHVAILGSKVKLLRNREIRKVKVQSTHYSPEDATWELEDTMRKAYPHLF